MTKSRYELITGYEEPNIRQMAYQILSGIDKMIDEFVKENQQDELIIEGQARLIEEK